MDVITFKGKSQRCRSQKLNCTHRNLLPTSLMFTIKRQRTKLDTSMENKRRLLQEQMLRTKKASFNLLTHLRLKEIVKAQEEKNRKQQILYNQCAIKIQKCFRGYIQRKKITQLGFNLEKVKFRAMITSLEQSVKLFFLNSQSTLKVKFR